jgi:hypothetical protein
MVAPTWECNIVVRNKDDELIYPIPTEGSEEAYHVNPTDYVEYEVKTYADNGKLASDKINLHMLELTFHDDNPEEPVFEKLYDIPLTTNNDGYLKGKQKIPIWVKNKVIVFALTYGYDNSTNMSDEQKKREARQKMGYEILSYGAILATIVAAPFTGGASLAGTGPLAAGLLVADIAAGVFFENRHLFMGNLGRNKYGDKFPSQGYAQVIGMAVSPLPAESRKELLLNVVMIGAIISGFMAIKKYIYG